MHRPGFSILLTLVLISWGWATEQEKSAAEGGKMKDVRRDVFGTSNDGEAVDRFTLVNRGGSILKVIELGATVTELHVRDREGVLADVVLGFDRLAEYEVNEPYFGCTVGRVANRIGEGRFELDGKQYQLARNLGDHHLHGGTVGLHRRIWRGEPVDHAQGPGVRFSYQSPHNEDRYPGSLTIAVTYVLTQEDSLRIEYQARADQATPVNLTNHSYFNLSGAGSGTIRDHLVKLYAGQFTEPDAEGIPTGAILPVEGTALDFSEPKAIGREIDLLATGYDHNFVLDHGGAEQPQLSAEVYDPMSGRVMRLFTTEPGVQFYTSYYLGETRGKAGATYGQFQALCLEAQHFPDSVNNPQFPSVILRPGETYRQITEYRFSVR